MNLQNLRTLWKCQKLSLKRRNRKMSWEQLWKRTLMILTWNTYSRMLCGHPPWMRSSRKIRRRKKITLDTLICWWDRKIFTKTSCVKKKEMLFCPQLCFNAAFPFSEIQTEAPFLWDERGKCHLLWFIYNYITVKKYPVIFTVKQLITIYVIKCYNVNITTLTKSAFLP